MARNPTDMLFRMWIQSVFRDISNVDSERLSGYFKCGFRAFIGIVRMWIRSAYRGYFKCGFRGFIMIFQMIIIVRAFVMLFEMKPHSKKFKFGRNQRGLGRKSCGFVTQ